MIVRKREFMGERKRERKKYLQLRYLSAYQKFEAIILNKEMGVVIV